MRLWSRSSVADNMSTLPLIVDDSWMAQALSLALKGVGLASPNPTVGCVIVRDDKLVGSGFHEYDRRDHAEIVALREAGELARGATAYVTLEPCSHHGRTGPCADALIAAGLARVVVAIADPNPLVNGFGIERLRHAGIEVSVGSLRQPAQLVNDSFAKYIRTGLPFVTLKAAMTLDGRIAPSPSSPAAAPPGGVRWITGPKSRQHVQVMRHSVDAVITGIGTVLADDPLLTDRTGLRRRRPLMRVVMDSQLKIPLDSRLLQAPKDDVLVFCSNPSEERLRALSVRGATVRQITPEGHGQEVSPFRVLRDLGALQLTSVMIEGGSRINSSFLRAGLVDRLFLFYAPSFLGPEGRPVLASTPADSPVIRAYALHRFGPDFAMEAWLNDPWQASIPPRPIG